MLGFVAKFLKAVRRTASAKSAGDWRPADPGPAPPSSVFARDVLHALVTAGLTPDDAVRVLRPFEVTGSWLGPYALWGDRLVEADPVRFPGIETRRRIKLLEHRGSGIPGEVPVLLAMLYAAETETCDLPPDLDHAWKEAIRVAFVASERCVRDAWVDPTDPADSEPVEPEADRVDASAVAERVSAFGKRIAANPALAEARTIAESQIGPSRPWPEPEPT